MAGASFVSVTQAFNTATSMGRLTLNVLLSFAQFEREVTAERIRDKIAASKKKGLWMGGNVPLGYEALDRTLRIVPKEAEIVRTLFDLYEQRGTITAVAKEAAQLGLRSKLRTGRDGRPRGGSVMGRGQIHHVLANPVYAGRIRHKDQVHDGQHEAIIDPDRWEAVQARLMATSVKPRGKPAAAHPSPLAGTLFDETGDRLTPSYASKGGKRYRYYVSRRLVTGETGDNSGWRLPADQLERDLVRTVQLHLTDCITRGQLGSGDAPSIKRLRADAYSLGDHCLTFIHEATLGDGTIRIGLIYGAAAKSRFPQCAYQRSENTTQLQETCTRPICMHAKTLVTSVTCSIRGRRFYLARLPVVFRNPPKPALGARSKSQTCSLGRRSQMHESGAGRDRQDADFGASI